MSVSSSHYSKMIKITKLFHKPTYSLLLRDFLKKGIQTPICEIWHDWTSITGTVRGS